MPAPPLPVKPLWQVKWIPHQTVSYGGRRTVAPPHTQRRQRSAFFSLLPPFPSPPCLPPPSAAAVMVSLTSVSPSLYASTQHSDVRWHHSSARMSGSTTRNDSTPLSPDSPSHQAVTAARRFSGVTEETESVSGRAMTQFGGQRIENFHVINCDFRFFVLFPFLFGGANRAHVLANLCSSVHHGAPPPRLCARLPASQHMFTPWDIWFIAQAPFHTTLVKNARRGCDKSPLNKNTISAALTQAARTLETSPSSPSLLAPEVVHRTALCAYSLFRLYDRLIKCWWDS